MFGLFFQTKIYFVSTVLKLPPRAISIEHPQSILWSQISTYNKNTRIYTTFLPPPPPYTHTHTPQPPPTKKPFVLSFVAKISHVYLFLQALSQKFHSVFNLISIQNLSKIFLEFFSMLSKIRK